MEFTVKDNFTNIMLLVEKSFKFLNSVSLYKPVGWLAEVVPQSIKQAILEEVSQPSRRSQNLALTKNLVQETIGIIQNDQKIRLLEERIQKLESELEKKEAELRDSMIQLKLKEFKIKELDQKNLNYQKELLTNFDEFTSGIKKISKNLDSIEGMTESGQLAFKKSDDQNTTGVQTGNKPLRKATMDSSTQFDVFTEAISTNYIFTKLKEFKKKMKRKKIKNSSTQVDEQSLRLEIREFMDQQSQMVQDPVVDLKLDLANISQLSQYDYQLNPYLVYVAAVAHMQKLRQRDSQLKFQYFQNTFLEFNGGMFVEMPNFSIQMQSLLRRFTSEKSGFRLLSSSLFDQRSNDERSTADRIKLLISNKFYGPYLLPNGKFVLAQMDVRGKQFGWVFTFSDSPGDQSMEIYLAEDGACLTTALKISTDGVYLGIQQPEQGNISYSQIEDFDFQNKVKSFSKNFSELTTKTNEIKSIVSNLLSNTEETFRKLKGFKSDIDSQKSSISSARLDISSIESKIKSAVSSLKELEKVPGKVQSEISSLASKLRDTEGKIKDAEREFSKLR